jgi:hypothetical protein
MSEDPIERLINRLSKLEDDVHALQAERKVLWDVMGLVDASAVCGHDYCNHPLCRTIKELYRKYNRKRP